MSDNFISGTPVPLSEIPPAVQPRVSAQAPAAAKMLMARAVVPMSPNELGVALAVLARDSDEEIAKTARASLIDMPEVVLQDLMSNSELNGAVLDVFAHIFEDKLSFLQRLVANRSCYDETVRWMARKLKGTILDLIASNQVRLVRQPEIIVALVKNTATPTPLLARVCETAIRNGVDTTRIPGFKLLSEAFFGDSARMMAGAAAEELPAAEPEVAAVTEVAAEPEMAAEPEVAVEPELVAEVEAPTPLQLVPEPEVESESDLQSLLGQGGPVEAAVDAPESAEPEEPVRRKPLFKQIEDMNVPQKVRLALMGDASARKILVRDKVRVVAEAVMKSPKLTEKEVSAFVQDKALSGEIIRLIAKNREYTRNYGIMMALIYNPKTPPPMAVGFIRNLRRKDLQNLLRAKGVPAYVNRAARQIQAKRGDMG